eukprot:TRINITY_DN6485_c0_g1_i4.p1 TRINITY_DN6485_c0_g1~~TRINITY_DN6485_c0_g1_i4.p1  ORF type:complete len:434 (+),score=70.69 TRINITY_DN6485_c0_g1_i4:379-1680(+)
MDRFIPPRANNDLAFFNLTTPHFSDMGSQSASKGVADVTGTNVGQPSENGDSSLCRILAESMAVPCGEDRAKVINLRRKVEAPMTLNDSLGLIYSKALGGSHVKKSTRTLPQGPEKILDAPDMVDDYYLNLLDWGENQLLAVCLGRSVYLWNAANGEIHHLMQTDSAQNYITSVAWMNRGGCLAIGFADSLVQLWDVDKMTAIRDLRSHTARVSALAWNSHLLTSAGRDSAIVNNDVRVASHISSRLLAHQQEVCGLKWSPDGSQLASGGNDNILAIWDAGVMEPRFIMRDHRAAVKSLAWCPWQRFLLASGGGTADKSIKFWSTDSGALLNSVDAESQVCSLIWNRSDRELLSGHGFSKNQLALWRYPAMTKVGEMKGHIDRVLHMALSPDGSTVVSAAADETLRFWRVFDAPRVGPPKTKQRNVLASVNLR